MCSKRVQVPPWGARRRISAVLYDGTEKNISFGAVDDGDFSPYILCDEDSSE
jgi:hypothetical protein